MNLSDEDRKRLTEYMGEKWIDLEYLHDCVEHWKVTKCRDRNRTFDTPDDMVALKNRMDERGEWDKFRDFALIRFALKNATERIGVRVSHFETWLFDPIRFGELVSGWRKEAGDE